MKDFGNTIYALGCVVTATVLGIGVADYWFGNHQLTAFLSWAVLAAIPWLVGRASLFILASGRSQYWIKSECASSDARGRGGLGALSRNQSAAKWLNELTPRCYLAPASQCDSSSSSRRAARRRDASSDDAGDDSMRLA